ncbi:MAG: VOC family protein [Chloroflexaceae bacterium]|nr:VOC family protein [Chloroflexaceae bacterium]
MNLTFSYVRLLVRDFHACLEFYHHVLGFEIKLVDDDTVYAELETGKVTLALFGREDMAEAIGTDEELPTHAERQDSVTLIFAVDDVDVVFREIKEKGADIAGEPVNRREWNIRTAHFRDPDGNLVEINCRLKS